MLSIPISNIGGRYSLAPSQYLQINNLVYVTDISNCQSGPCGSHGTCADLSDSYHCICDVGYTGYNCNLSICGDNSSPCENNSTCSLCEEGVCNSTGLSFQCECVDDFYGVLCTDRKLIVKLAGPAAVVCL